MPEGRKAVDKDHHLMSEEDVLKALDSRLKGLGADEVEERIERYGRNEIARKKADPVWKKFLRQFTDALVIVLLIAAVITFIMDPKGIDWMVIGAIVLINAIIGFVQEEKAEKAIESLKKMAAPRSLVFRDGIKIEKNASELVPGDVIYIESGMRIPADARLLESHSLKVNEAALTGESAASEKNTHTMEGSVPLAERDNMIYMSTAVETGHGKAVVTGTGMGTQIGHIAGMLQEVERIETPLQKRLKKLGKKLGYLVLAVCVLIFVLEISREYHNLDLDYLMELFETSVSLAVAAIPEGLPAVVTISLAIGLSVMAKKKVIVRKLPVVETLGSATVICTDKTGTLTTGTMTADILHIGNEEVSITGSGYEPKGYIRISGKKADIRSLPEAFDHIMRASVLCSDADMSEEDGKRIVLGDTTEGAVIVMAEKSGLNYEGVRDEFPRIDEIPFDSDRKLMSSLHDIDGKKISYTKGAPESVLCICVNSLENGLIKGLTDDRREDILKLTGDMAREGYRTLAFSFRHGSTMETGMTFLGMVGIRDKIRPEAKKAVAKARRAGVRSIMITGDHRLTATAIGKELDLIKKDSEALNCRDLDSMDNEEFLKTIAKVSVYARASPEHKVRIVTGLKELGEIVAMTGDGVNDAPALKKADIGVAMGITGTDVSKEASDMILIDDNYASIVSAVEEGRGIYDNIRKVIQFLLSCNMGEVMVMLVAILIGWELPLIALQILWMNLVTDSFPALALVSEPKEKDLMKRKPRDPKEGAITKDMMISIGVSAVIITVGTLLVFGYNHYIMDRSLALSRTVALTTMVMFQMWTAISARSTTHRMKDIGWFTNPKLLGAIILAVALMLPIIYIPFIQGIFGTASIGVVEWAEIMGISVFGLVAVEIWEWFNRRFFHFGAGTPDIQKK